MSDTPDNYGDDRILRRKMTAAPSSAFVPPLACCAAAGPRAGFQNLTINQLRLSIPTQRIDAAAAFAPENRTSFAVYSGVFQGEALGDLPAPWSDVRDNFSRTFGPDISTV